MTPATLLKLKQTSPAVAAMWNAYLDGVFPSLEAALIHLAECQSRIITDLVYRTHEKKHPLDDRLEADKQRAMFHEQIARHADEERRRKTRLQEDACIAEFYDQFRPSRRQEEAFKAEMFNTPGAVPPNPPQVIPSRDWGYLKAESLSPVPQQFPIQSKWKRRHYVNDRDECPQCGGTLDTGWECNSCGFDASAEVVRVMPETPTAKAQLANDLNALLDGETLQQATEKPPV